MEIICPKCGRKAQIPDNKLPDVPVNIRCKKCGTEFPVQKPEPDPEQEAVSEQLSDGRLKVRCPECNSAYVIDPNKMPSGIIKTKCHKCQNDFVFRIEKPPVQTPPLSEPPGAFPGFSDIDSKGMNEPPKSNDTPIEIEPEPEEPYADTDSEIASRRGLLIPIGVKSQSSQNSDKPTGYFIIDEDSNVSGPFDILMLRNWVRSGQITEKTFIEMPDGGSSLAGKIPDLESTFEALKKIEVLPDKPPPQIPTLREFFGGILSGALAGVVFGLALAIAAVIVGPKILPIVGGESENLKTIVVVLIVPIVVCLGGVIGLSISAIQAVNRTKDPSADVWNSEMAGALGASLGGILAIILLLSNNADIFVAFGTVIVLYLMSRGTTLVFKQLFRSDI